MHLKFIAASLAAAIIAGPAVAADRLPVKAGPAMLPPPAFSWTGFYVGANVGAGWNAIDPQSGSQFYTGTFGPAGPTTAWTNSMSSPRGLLGGLQAGYNWQVSPWLVAGLETDIQRASIHGDGFVATAVTVGTNGLAAHNGAIALAQRTDWFGTLRARVGVTPFAAPVLFYATGGLAYGSVKTSFAMADSFPLASAIITGAAAGSATRSGWTVGGGAEWAITPSWSIKGEYLHVDLGGSQLGAINNVLVTGPAPFPIFVENQSYHTSFDVVRVGVNYRFGSVSPLAAFARN
jgi:outer membrane immunogenic protein